LARILVSGAGIAGLTLAYWLRRARFDVVVLERAPALRRGGYGLDFFGTGFDVADRMGIVDALAAHQVPIQALVYVDTDGKPFASLPIERIRRILGGRYMALMHDTLIDVLYDALPKEVDLRFGTSLRAIAQESDAVDVTFDDGSHERFDIVVGADGVHSKTRALVAGPEESFRRLMGYTIASYEVPNRYGLGPNWTMFVEPDRLVGTYAHERADRIWAFFMYRGDAELKRAFAGMRWIVPELLADADAAENVFRDVVEQIEMPSWHQGRVVFIGDACGAPTLASGQGASLAMGGAYVLAECLQLCGEHVQAFQRYEQRVRPYVVEQQRDARRFMKMFLPSTSLGVALQRAILKVVFQPQLTWLLRRQFNVRSIL